MKRLGVLLALLVLGSLLTVGTDRVSATTGTTYQFIVREYYDGNVTVSAASYTDNNIWLPSGNGLTVDIQPGQGYVDYIMSVGSKADLYALFATAFSGTLQFMTAVQDAKTQYNLTYAVQSKEYYLNGISSITKIFVGTVKKSGDWIGSGDYVGKVQLKYPADVAVAGAVSTSDTTNEAAAVLALPNAQIFNFSDTSTWLAVAAVGSKATSAVGVSNSKGLVLVQSSQNPGVDVKIYDYLNYKSTSGTGDLIVFLSSENAILSQSGFSSTTTLDVIPYTYQVTFNLKDGMTDQSLSGVTVKEGDTVLGTLDDGGTLTLTRGQHTLTFEKSGYWSVTKTIDVESDTSLSVEMYPSSAAFKLENFPSDISIPENTIYTLTFTLSPIQTSATYNTYLSISGLSNIISVEKGGSVISPEDGKYYLGDISSPVQVSIKFKAGAVGQHGFTLTLTSNDAIMSQTYTTTKTVTYQVEPLPFSVQMPSEWQVGQNDLRISESSGQSYLITAVLKDSGGNEVWSDSHAFSPYEAHTFTVNVPSEGSYTLELQWNGKTAVYSVQVNPAITLKTKTLSVEKGGEGTIVLHFKNPSSDVQYYTITVSGGFLPKAINQSISVAPATEKDVSIAFAVPDKLTYDAYELNVQVLQGNATVFSNKVAVSINSGGFSLFGGGSSGGKTLIYLLAGLIVVGVGVWALRRR